MKTYEEALAEVNTFGGESIYNPVVDEEIKDLVAGLIMHGFVTSSSCAGHPEVSCRCYPKVFLNYEDPEDDCEDIVLRRWIRKNVMQQKRLSEYLEEFYQNHEPVIFKSRLMLNTIELGITILRPYGSEFLEYEDFDTLHPIYLKEMQDFGEFLIHKK